MYCANCGAELPDDVKFCPKCGTAIKEKSKNTEDARSEQETKKASSSSSSNGNRKTASSTGRVSGRRSIRCPQCGSKNLQYWANKKGASAGKGCCGFIACGPLGLLFSLCGANRKEEYWVCRDCGYEFNPNSLGNIAKEAISGTEEDKIKKEMNNARAALATAQEGLTLYGSIENLSDLIATDEAELEEEKAESKRIEKEIRSKSPALRALAVVRVVCTIVAILCVILGIVMVVGGDSFGWFFGFLLAGVVIFLIGPFTYGAVEKRVDADSAEIRDQHDKRANELEKELKKKNEYRTAIQNMAANQKVVEDCEAREREDEDE